jgi:hypothetical protein
MKKEDFIIQSEVRRMLIRSNIDYSRIDFGTVKGVVYFRGFFRLPVALESHEEVKQSMTIKTLLSFEKKVRSIPGVVDVIFQFNNWLKEKGQWIPIKSARREEKGRVAEAKPDAKSEEKGENEDEGEMATALHTDLKRD